MNKKTAKLLNRIATKEAMEWPAEQRKYVKLTTYGELKKVWKTLTQKQRAQLHKENP